MKYFNLTKNIRKNRINFYMTDECFIKIENILCAQFPGTLETFSKIIKSFDLIIEIGANRGGFTIWLFQNKNNSCKLHSYEIDENILEIQRSHDAYSSVIFDDCFSNESIENIKNLINSNGRTLILCDGGNKINEFNLYSQYLKNNDVIMLHDFSDSPNEQEKWNSIRNKLKGFGFTSPESTYKDIENSVIKNNLQKYMYDDFLQIFWGSFTKI